MLKEDVFNLHTTYVNCSHSLTMAVQPTVRRRLLLQDCSTRTHRNRRDSGIVELCIPSAVDPHSLRLGLQRQNQSYYSFKSTPVFKTFHNKAVTEKVLVVSDERTTEVEIVFLMKFNRFIYKSHLHSNICKQLLWHSASLK